MADLQTAISEVVTGLGMCGDDDVGVALKVRPDALENVSDDEFGRLGDAWNDGQHRDLFVASFMNGQAFLRAYMAAFRFQSIDTRQFLELLEAELPRLSQKARAMEWIDQAGIPADAPQPKSRRLDELQGLAASSSVPPADITPTELLVYLHAVKGGPTESFLRDLDARFGLSQRKSLELRHTFVLMQLRAGQRAGIEGARRVVSETGRMKYLRPIYQELAKRDRAVAKQVFAEVRETYHPIARAVVEGLLREG